MQRNLGQQVIYGKPPNQYSNTTDAARPYPSEESILSTGQTQPIDSSRSHTYMGQYGSVQPPPIPYIDEEKDRLLAEQNTILWPRDSPYNMANNLGQDPGLLSDPSGWMLKWVTPENAWGWVISGAVLIGLSQTKKLKYTVASPVLAGGGGIILGIGVIPFIMKATKKKEKP